MLPPQQQQQHDESENMQRQDKEDNKEKPKTTSGKKEGKDKYSSSPRGRGRGGISVLSHRRGGHVQLVGKNTFAAPRAIIRPLGFSQQKPSTVKKQDDEAPKSNEDFRKMLLKQ